MRLKIVGLLLLLIFPVMAPSGTVGSGSTTCASSGNKAIASSAVYAAWWIVQSPSTNAGNIYIGGSAVSTSTGVYITPGGSLNAPPRSNTASFDLSMVYFACATNTDSITYLYAQ